MKKLTLSLLLFGTMALSATAQLVYTFDAATGVLTISGNGTTVEANKVKAAANPTTKITSIDFNAATDITAIGKEAFKGCSGLTSITLPNSVATIGNNAFEGSSSLTSLTLPNSLTAIGESVFSGCSGLTSLALPASLTSIGGWAFYKCSGLTTLALPASVTSIGNSAFSWCSGMTEITCYRATEPTIEGNTFANGHATRTLYVPHASSGFIATNWGKAGSVTIKYSVFPPISFTVGNFTYFAGDGVVILTGYVTKPTGTLTLPSKVTYNGKEYTITSIGENAFSQCSGLASLTLPNSLTSIGKEAFYWCGGLTSLTLPTSLTSIGASAFSQCIGLTSLVLPASLTAIENRAFKSCSGLAKLVLPNSVTSIGAEAFYGCERLTEITCFRATEPTIGSNTFGNESTTRTLYVPNASSGFTATKWGNASTVTIKYGEQPVGITSPEAGNEVNAYVANGELMLQGLTRGTTYTLVNASGSVVTTGVVTNDAVNITLPQRGIYMIQAGEKSTKVLY